MVTLFSKNSNLSDHNSPTSQTDGRTDGQTTCDRNTALCTKVHRAVKIVAGASSKSVSRWIDAQTRIHTFAFHDVLEIKTSKKLLKRENGKRDLNEKNVNTFITSMIESSRPRIADAVLC